MGLISNYSFNAAARTVTFNDIAAPNQSWILGIFNVTRGVYLYDPTYPSTGSMAGNVFTLTYNTTSMSNTDMLRIAYADPNTIGENGMDALSATAPAGAKGLRGWLSALYVQMQTLVTTQLGTGSTAGNSINQAIGFLNGVIGGSVGSGIHTVTRIVGQNGSNTSLYLMLFDATSQPANGSVPLAECAVTLGGGLSIPTENSRSDLSVGVSTGVWLAWSSTPGIYTPITSAAGLSVEAYGNVSAAQVINQAIGYLTNSMGAAIAGGVHTVSKLIGENATGTTLYLQLFDATASINTPVSTVSIPIAQVCVGLGVATAPTEGKRESLHITTVNGVYVVWSTTPGVYTAPTVTANGLTAEVYGV